MSDEQGQRKEEGFCVHSFHPLARGAGKARRFKSPDGRKNVLNSAFFCVPTACLPRPPAPPLRSVSRCLQILSMPSSGSGAKSFSLLTNKLAFVLEWLHLSSPLSSAAGEAGRKFSMKQRRHAARWLTSGAQGHRC